MAEFSALWRNGYEINAIVGELVSSRVFGATVTIPLLFPEYMLLHLELLWVLHIKVEIILFYARAILSLSLYQNQFGETC